MLLLNSRFNELGYHEVRFTIESWENKLWNNELRFIGNCLFIHAMYHTYPKLKIWNYATIMLEQIRSLISLYYIMNIRVLWKMFVIHSTLFILRDSTACFCFYSTFNFSYLLYECSKPLVCICVNACDVCAQSEAAFLLHPVSILPWNIWRSNHTGDW